MLANNLKIALQKSGRLSENSINVLRSAGLRVKNYNKYLYSTCKNFPLDLLYVRSEDIPYLVSKGYADLGITGEINISESNLKVRKICDFDFGFCSLVLAVPQTSEIKDMSQLKNRTVVTSFPINTKHFFKENGIKVKIIKLGGSIELFPAVDAADAIVDVRTTGNTLKLHKLKVIRKICDSKTVLIVNSNIFNNSDKSKFAHKLINLINFRTLKSPQVTAFNATASCNIWLPKIKEV